MSYILDALRKSDAERKKLAGRREQPYTTPAAGAAAGKSSRLVPAAILTSFLALTILMFGGAWWLAGRFGDSSAADQPLPAAAAKGVERPGGSRGTSAAGSVPPDTATAAPAIPDQPPSAVRPPPESAAPAAANPSPPVVQTRAELPPAIQAALPEMKFSGHVYSPTPKLRLIMINSAILREGDRVAPDLVLEEITEDGLVLRYRQTPFSIDLF